MNKPKPQEKFVVRFPHAGLRQQLADEALNAQRSMNSEIVYRLARTLELEEALRRAHAVIDQLIADRTENGEGGC